MRKKSPYNLKRRKNFKSLRKSFLIVCEGEKTIEIRDSETTSYDEVWCVFDRDAFPVENFNRALSLAKKNNIKVAYSNEAFEILYLLHFHFHDAATSRTQYKAMLTQRLGFPYKKNDPNMYEHLVHLQETAIKNATNLLNSYVNHNPATDNPSTKVHNLVKKLNEHSV